MLYSRGSDFLHNGGYFPLMSLVPQKSHWIYLGLCTMVIMWARRSSGSFECNPSSILSLPLLPSSSPSLSSPLISFLNTFFIFFSFCSQEIPAHLICLGVIWLRGIPKRIDRVKSRLLTSPCAKTHSFIPIADSFFPLPGSRHWHMDSGEEEEELRSQRSPSCSPIGQTSVFLSDVSSRNLGSDS